MTPRKLIAAFATCAVSLLPSAAHAADLCLTLKAAIKVGMSDKAFVSLQSTPLNGRETGMFNQVTVPSKLKIDRMVCEISLEGGRGYHSCKRTGVDGMAEITKIAEQVQQCLAKTPDTTPGSTGLAFTIRTSPKLIVSISGGPKAVYLNVVAW